MNRAPASILAALVISLCISACSEDVRGGEAVKNEVYVLVDLSQTWFNDQTADRNRKLLTSVGEGAGLMATELDPPYLVQYRIIGNNSYLREPICSAVYVQGFRRSKTDSERVNRPGKLLEYLTKTCVDGVMARPPETLTQLSAAIASVALEPKPDPRSQRHIVIMSDFLEETSASAPIQDRALDQIHVLLLFRPLSEDQKLPADTTERVEQWKELLTAKGALVDVAPDSSVRPSEIVSFLKK